MRPLRRLMLHLEPDLADDDDDEDDDDGGDASAEGKERGAREGKDSERSRPWAQGAAPVSEAQLGPVVATDIDAAVLRTKSSAPFGRDKYEAWQKEFGAE